MTAEKQAVVEENEFKDFLDFQVMKRDAGVPDIQRVARYVDEQDGYFVPSPEFINDTLVELRQQGINETIIADVIDIINRISWSTYESYDYESAVYEIEQGYNGLMKLLYQKDIVNYDDDHYTFTKTAQELVRAILDMTIFSSESYQCWVMVGYNTNRCDFGDFH